MALPGQVTTNGLHIDKVLSTQPELGPSIPDGGYGWVIVGAAVFFKGLIPSLWVGLGVFVMFWRLENNSSTTDPTMWDCKLIYVCWLFTITSTVTEPWTRKLALNSTWPRLVATSGICLTCAGLLLIWVSVTNGNRLAVLLLAGVLAGGGTSIVLSQTDVLLSQYFNVKLDTTHTILNVASALGFVITPIALGFNIVKLGVPQVLTWYQAIILQGIIVSIAFKKPQYLKKQRSNYKLVRGISDDEEDIFAKTTELQNPRPVNTVKTEVSVEAAGTSSNSVQDPWVKFEEDCSDEVKRTKAQVILHKTFAKDFNDLDRIESADDSAPEIPHPLFSENHVNNNTSYSYEAPAEMQNPVVFMPVKRALECGWRQNVEVLKEAAFYKSLLFMIVTKYSTFVFWTLFPSYLYVEVDSLKDYQATVIVGCVSVASLLFIALTAWIKSNSNIRDIFLWGLCWLEALGYFVLSDSNHQTALVFGAMIVALTINALQILGVPLLKLGHRGETTRTHTMLCVLTGVSFLFFLITNLRYKTCFRFMASLQLLMGSLWFSNYIYKRIRKRTNHH